MVIGVFEYYVVDHYDIDSKIDMSLCVYIFNQL